MSSQAPAYVRTGTPIVAGPVLVALARALGVDLTEDQLLVLVPAVSYAYYVLARALEHLNPTLGWILGVAKQPAYSSKEPPQPEPELAEDEPLHSPFAHDTSANPSEDGVDLTDVDANAVVQGDKPVQTDNRPRPEDGEQLDPVLRGDDSEWTGTEMR